jgi:hypothetical protein
MSPPLSDWTWFEYNFPWLGLSLAIPVLTLLFFFNRLQANKEISRWKDYSWLSWLGMVAYLIHNVDEYGIDVLGNVHEFPRQATAMLQELAPEGKVPDGLFYTMVNVSAFWVAAPLASLISRRYPLSGLMIYGIIAVNALMHLRAALTGAGLGGGNFTAVFLFLPLSAWTLYQCFRSGRLSRKGLVILLAGGVLVHGILALSFFLYLSGKINYTPAVCILGLNPFLLLALLNLWERKMIRHQ